MLQVKYLTRNTVPDGRNSEKGMKVPESKDPIGPLPGPSRALTGEMRIESLSHQPDQKNKTTLGA